jgi:predicted naringenin-chalcone synthase
MFSREDDKLTNTAIWQNLDFKKVKQRFDKITDKLERVRRQSSQIEARAFIDPEDYAKLREFMEQNELTESQAIAMIVNAFFNSP